MRCRGNGTVCGLSEGAPYQTRNIRIGALKERPRSERFVCECFLFGRHLSRGAFPRTAERIAVDQDDDGNADSAQSEGPVTAENH